MRNRQKNLSIGRTTNMVEPLLSGIVLGLIPVTLAGLFVAAYMQYKRGDQLGINK
jgi:cytochrome b6-f complex subunit 5